MSTSEFIKDTHFKRGKKYTASLELVEEDEELSLLVSSHQSGQSDYSNLDIFLILQLAQDNGVDFFTFLRHTVFELSQHMSPEDFIGKMKDSQYSLKIDETSLNRDAPTASLESLGGERNKIEPLSRYYSLLNTLINESSIEKKPLNKEHIEAVKEFLKEYEGAPVLNSSKPSVPTSNEVEEKKTTLSEKISEEELEEFLKDASYFLFAIHDVEEKGTEFVHKMEKKTREVITSIDETLLPEKNTPSEGLNEDNLIVYNKKVRGAIIGELVVRWNRRR